MKPTAIFVSECPKECKNSAFERLFYGQEIIHRLKLISDDETTYALIGEATNCYSIMTYSQNGRFLYARNHTFWVSICSEWSNPELIP